MLEGGGSMLPFTGLVTRRVGTPSSSSLPTLVLPKLLRGMALVVADGVIDRYPAGTPTSFFGSVLRRTGVLVKMSSSCGLL